MSCLTHTTQMLYFSSEVMTNSILSDRALQVVELREQLWETAKTLIPLKSV